jgi:hypothetical protein
MSWFRKLFGGRPKEGAGSYVHVPGQVTRVSCPGPGMRAVNVMGRWVELLGPAFGGEPFIGFAYVDRAAGLSAKGDRASAPNLVDGPTMTVRLPMRLAWRTLDAAECTSRNLPAKPPWLHHFGPQPDTTAPWFTDPFVAEHAHESFPADIQVRLHDGEPRRTGRQPELCWVRVHGAERLPARVHIYNADAAKMGATEFDAKYAVTRWLYRGALMNQPHHLECARQGEEVRFVAGQGLQNPLLVTAQYVEEWPGWQVQPCGTCGMADTLDPPSVMARHRFPDTPPGDDVQAFTAFCGQCGKEGMQMLTRVA